MKKASFLFVLFLLAVGHVSSQEQFRPNATDRTKKVINYKLPFFSNPQDLHVEVVDGYVIFEGDIILYKEGLQKDAGIEGDNFRWDRGVIPYEIEEGHPQSEDILEAIRTLNEIGVICVVPRNGEFDYVEFVNEASCSSSVGRRGGKQEIEIGGCSIGSIQHEILHTAGMFHEQSRSDRDNFVTINFENIQPGFENNFRIVENTISVCPYDFGSIMHYSAFAFSRNGQPTITPIDPLPPGIVMGQRVALSSCDILGLENLYPNASSCESKYWKVSYGAVERWQNLEHSHFKLSRLRFGDFNGDGSTDVFSVSNGQWRYSQSGASKWIDLETSKVPLEKLVFGDFNGDGITDIFVTEADMK